MKKIWIRVGCLLPVVGAFTAVEACSTSSPKSQERTSVASAAPPATPKSGALYYFQGSVSVAQRQMSLVYTDSSGAVFRTESLPYGTGANEVYLHTEAESQIFDTKSTAGCNGTVGDPHFCAEVSLVNGFSGSVTGTSVVFTSVTPVDVTVVGAPYSYGSVAGGGTHSADVEWVFDDPSSEDFTFSGEVDGVAAGSGGGDAGAGDADGEDGGTDGGGNSEAGTAIVEITGSVNAANDSFGGSVAISGATAIVGAADQAYIFAASGSSWTQVGSPLAPSSGTVGSGYSVAIDGATAIVGNSRNNEAYIFAQSGSSWTQVGSPLVPSDGALDFGISVGVSGTTAIIGGGNEAYIFAPSGSSWAQVGRPLVASDGTTGFGWSVAISGTTALIGDYHTDGNSSGEAYIFSPSGSSWAQVGSPLFPATRDSYFGFSVAISGSTAVIGTQSADGKAYVFAQSGSSWTQSGGPLVASDGATGFGLSVAISGTVALVGGPATAGEAYVFAPSGSSWTQVGSPVIAPTGTGWFGGSVAVSGSTAIVGALGTTVGGNSDQGAAYIFGL